MWGKATTASLSEGDVGAIIQVQEHFRQRFKKLAEEQPLGEHYVLDLSVNLTFTKTEKPGIIHFELEDLPDIYLQKRKARATRAQQNTLWGICYFIAWAQDEHKPSAETKYWVREAIIEEYAPLTTNPINNHQEHMRPSDPRMTTAEMSVLIQGALAELSEQNIPKHVEDEIGKDIHKLWKEWYEWRWSQEEDPLGDYQAKTWEQFVKENPVCMACGQGATNNDPLERQHIVSVGADKSIEEQHWNWLYTHRSHHAYQHGRGWEPFTQAFPHLKPRIERAHTFAADHSQLEIF